MQCFLISSILYTFINNPVQLGKPPLCNWNGFRRFTEKRFFVSYWWPRATANHVNTINVGGGGGQTYGSQAPSGLWSPAIQPSASAAPGLIRPIQGTAHTHGVARVCRTDPTHRHSPAPSIPDPEAAPDRLGPALNMVWMPKWLEWALHVAQSCQSSSHAAHGVHSGMCTSHGAYSS